MNLKYTDEEKHAVFRRYKNGETVASITESTNIPRSTIYSWIRSFSFTNRQKTEISVRNFRLLQNKVARLEGIIEIIHKAHCFASDPLQIKLAALEELYGQYNIHMLCDALQVSRGTFYNHIWRNKKSNTWYSKRREEFRVKIQQIYDDNHQIFGACKIHAAMKEQGYHISVGSYTEIIFPRNHVRYIAINDNFDSLYAEGNELAPFKNLFNEWYARDTSKKIRAVKRAKAERGERIGSRPPYGYVKDPNDSKKIIIDEETAPVVRQIFAMCVEGLGPTMIANKLKEMEILTPVMYEYRKSGTAVTCLDPDRPYDWNAKTVADILSKEDYIGNTVNCRFTVPSFKDKRKVRTEASEQLRFEHTHEPIIDEITWETVQKIRAGKRRPMKMGGVDKYSGLLYCADCGAKMYLYRKRSEEPKSYSFNCSHYRNNTKVKCTPYRIREVVLDQILLEELRRITYAARSKEREFAAYINKKSSSENRKELTAKQRERDRLLKRKTELNALFKRLYEDNVLGRVTNEQFRMLSDGYTDEQQALNLRLPELEKEIQQLTESASNVDKFITLAKKYTRITKLTPEILHTFISKIVIHERSERYKQHSEQQIDIYFTHIGIVGEA